MRRGEAKCIPIPKTTRWGVLKNADGQLTEQQIAAIAELAALDMRIAACRIKETLRWIRKATSEQAAKWRITAFLKFARALCDLKPALAPVRKGGVIQLKNTGKLWWPAGVPNTAAPGWKD